MADPTRSSTSDARQIAEFSTFPAHRPPISSLVDTNRTTTAAGPALIINTGAVPGLIACWSEGVVRPATMRRGAAPSGDRPIAPIAWFPSDDRPARERRKAAVSRQVELCSLAGF